MINSDQENEKILSRLRFLEERLEKVEEELGISNSGAFKNPSGKIPENGAAADQKTDEEDSWLEVNFGQYGLAWMGNLVLLFGVTFLNNYLSHLGLGIFSMLTGYILVAGVFVLSRLFRTIHSYMSYVLKLNGYFLLFYITLRLHFFSADPIIKNEPLSIVLLLFITGVISFIAIRKENQVLAGFSLIFGLVIAVISNRTHITLPVIIAVAGVSTFYLFRYSWKSQMVISLLTGYLIFLLWLFNNPLMGQTNNYLPQYNYGLIYLFMIVLIYSIIPFLKNDEQVPQEFISIMTIVNGFMFLVMLAIIVFQSYSEHYVWIFTFISAYCLIYSVLLKKYTTRKFVPSFYALYGFVAMSIAVYGLYHLPGAYWLLSIQSLLVVSMALWFRSKIIVIMNLFLFVTLLLLYLFSSGYVDGVNFAFAFVALISARILNWKRKLLEIETNLLRNFYLFVGFFMMLFALYHALPGKYVTVSWTLAALGYFLLSFILKNIKYRFMSLGTLVAAAFYLFIVDLANIEIIFRVLALMFLSLITIAVSVYYSRRNKNKEKT